MSATVEVEVSNPRIHAKGHVEYECVWDSAEPVEGAVATFRRLRWSTWKRFNDFAALHEALVKQYGYACSELLTLPPKQTFGTKDPAFIRERQALLQEYMRGVLTRINGVLAFHKEHQGSEALKQFMCWDSRHSLNILPAFGGAATSSSSAAAGAGAPTTAAAAGAGAGAAAPAAATIAPSRPVAASLRHQTRQAIAAGSGSLPAAAVSSAISYTAVLPTGTTVSLSSAATGSVHSSLAPAPAPVPRTASAPQQARPSAAAPAPAAAVQARPPAAAAPAPAAAQAAPAAGGAGAPAAARPAGGPPAAPAGPAAPRPPAPPAPGAAAPPPPSSAKNAVLGDITKGGFKLKKTKTNDRSAPKL